MNLIFLLVTTTHSQSPLLAPFLFHSEIFFGLPLFLTVEMGRSARGYVGVHQLLLFHCSLVTSFYVCFFFCLWFFFFFLVFMAVPLAHWSSQGRGWIGAAAACLYHNHSNMGSELHLVTHTTHISQQYQILKPLIRAREQTHILMDTSEFCYHLNIMGIPCLCV